MTTIKSYTDIDQSRKLAGILPLESADMFCADVFNKEEETHSYNFHILSTWGCNTFEELKNRENKFVHFIPCWSLAALLDAMICPNLEEYIEGVWDLTAFTDNTLKTPVEIQDCKDPVDACVAMIEKLHEMKML